MNKPKLLHFEDDAFLLGIYAAKFRTKGFDVASYENPSSDPVSIVLKEKPDLIIMDIIMPVMDGYAATRILKQDKRTKDIPIFGFCNLGLPEDIKKALDLGMVDYWVPAEHTPDEVVEKVKSLIKVK